MKKVLKQGEINYGEIGQMVPFRSTLGSKLYVGDVVIVYDESDKRECSPSFVVKDEGGYFIMGIQCASQSYDRETKQIKNWKVRLLKGYKDIEVGESYDGIALELEGQLNDNKIKESVVVENTKFKVGNKIKIVNWKSVKSVKDGDIAEIIKIEDWSDQEFKIKMDKNQDVWHAFRNEIELIKDSNTQQLTITTSGTTTKVKFEDGREGVAKLFHGDKYNKTFGILTALSKALGIDLIDEVSKVVMSYPVEPTKKEVKVFAESTKLTPKFKIGDKVEMNTEHAKYGSCSVKIHDIGEVTSVRAGYNRRDIVCVRFKTHDCLSVDPKDIKLIETPKFEVGCKVKIPKTKNGRIVTKESSSYHIKHADMINQDYLILCRIDKRCGKDVYVLSTVYGLHQGDYFDLEDLESYVEPTSNKSGFILKGNPTIKITNKTTGKVLVEGTIEPNKNPILKEEKRDFKNGDKVKLVSNTCYCRLAIGDIAVVIDDEDQSCLRLEKDGNSTSCYIPAKDIKLVEEDIIPPEFKEGDYIYFKMDGEYDCCKITKIEDEKLWGFWTKESKKTLPKTIGEFNKIRKETSTTYARSTDTSDPVKKLVLIDDTKPKFIVDQELKTIEEVKEFIELGGKVKEADWCYYLKDGILTYDMHDGTSHESSGYKYIKFPVKVCELPSL